MMLVMKKTKMVMVMVMAKVMMAVMKMTRCMLRQSGTDPLHINSGQFA